MFSSNECVIIQAKDSDYYFQTRVSKIHKNQVWLKSGQRFTQQGDPLPCSKGLILHKNTPEMLRKVEEIQDRYRYVGILANVDWYLLDISVLKCIVDCLPNKNPNLT